MAATKIEEGEFKTKLAAYVSSIETALMTDASMANLTDEQKHAFCFSLALQQFDTTFVKLSDDTIIYVGK